MSTKTSGAAANIMGAGKLIGGALVGATGIIAGLSVAVGKLASDAAPIPQVSAAFARLGGDIAAMRAGSAGMVTDIDLMKQYNTAVSLVSKDFAQQLPSAMGLLQKASAATGQSMDYFMSSLITGVGRVQPLILDNLQVTVTAAEANAKYAASVGKSADDLSKSEQQMAIMNLTMEKLRETYGSLEDVSGSAATQQAALGTTFANLKNDIGVAFIPALQAVMTEVSKIVKDAGPGIVAWAQEFGVKLAGTAEVVMSTIIPAISELAGWIGNNLVTPISEAIRWFTELDPAAQRFGLAVAGAAAAVPLLTAAFGLLNAVLLANPIVLVAAGIAGVTIVIMNAIDKMNQEIDTQKNATATSEAAGAAALATASSYDAYVASMTEAIRVGNDVPPGMSDAAIAASALEDGLMMTKDAWEEYAASTERSAEQATRAWQQLIDESGEMAKIDLSVDTTGMGISSDDIRSEMADMREAAAEGAKEINDVMETAFTSKGYIDALGAIEDATANHQQRLAGISQSFADEQVNAQFQYGFQRAQAEQQYQQQLLALQAAGRMEEAAQLTAKFAEQESIAAGQYSIDQQMAQRNLLIQQIQAQRAYIQELQERQDQAQRVLAAEVIKNTKFQELTRLQQDTILQEIYLGGSKRLAQEYEDAQNSLTIQRELTNGTITAVEARVRAQAAEQRARAGAAEDALRDLEAQRDAFTIEMPPLPDISLPEISGGRAAASAAARQVTEPATRALADVASDINKAVTEAMEALSQLAEIDVPEGTEAAMQRVADFLVMSVGVLYAAAGDVDKEAAEVYGLVTTATSSLVEAFGSFLDLDISSREMPDLTTWKANVIELGTTVVEALQGIVGVVGEEDLRKAQEFAGVAASLFDFVTPAIDSIVAITGYVPTESLAIKVKDMVTRLGEIIPALLELSTSWNTKAVKAASTFMSAAKGVVEFVKPGIEAIQSLAEYVAVGDISGKVTAFVGDMRLTLKYLLDLSIDFDTKAAEAAATLYKSLEGIVSIVEPGIDALAALVDYETDIGLADSITDFVDDLELVVNLLEKAKDRYDADGISAANSLYASMKDIVAIIKPGLEALAALKDYETAAGLVPSVRAFAADLYDVVEELRDTSTDYGLEGVVAANTLYAAMTDIVDIVIPGIEALLGLADYTRDANIIGHANDFASDLFWMVSQLELLSAFYDSEAIGVANTLYASMTDIVDIVGSGIDALASLVDYERNVDIIGNTSDFGADLFWMVNQLEIMSHFFLTDAILAANALYASMTDIVGIVEPGIAAITALFGYRSRANVAKYAETFGDDLYLLIVALNEVATKFELDAVEAASDFYAAVSTVIEIVQPALQALFDLGRYNARIGLLESMQEFTADLFTVVDEMAKLSAREGMAAAVVAAASFSSSAKSITEFVEPAITMLNRIANHQVVSGLAGENGKMAKFAAEIVEVFRKVSEMATDTATYIEPAGDFSNNVLLLAATMDSALDLMQALVVYRSDSVLTQTDMLLSNIKSVFRMISNMLVGIGDPVGAADAFRVMAESIYDDIAGGMDLLTRLGVDYGGGIIPIATQVGEALESSGNAARSLGTTVGNAFNVLGSDFGSTTREVEEFEESWIELMESMASQTLGLTDAVLQLFTMIRGQIAATESLISSVISAVEGMVSTAMGLLDSLVAAATSAQNLINSLTTNVGGDGGGLTKKPTTGGENTGVPGEPGPGPDPYNPGNPRQPLPQTSNPNQYFGSSQSGPTVQISMGPVTISNGMDMAQFKTAVLQTVNTALRGG